MRAPSRRQVQVQACDCRQFDDSGGGLRQGTRCHLGGFGNETCALSRTQNPVENCYECRLCTTLRARYCIAFEAPAAGNYVAHRLVGSLLFVSGQIPRIDVVEHFVGVVGREVSPEDGYRAARLCALNLVARVSAALDRDLDRGRRWQMQYSFDFAPVFAA
nr:RidA family protein [Sinorhizobium meliloti]